MAETLRQVRKASERAVRVIDGRLGMSETFVPAEERAVLEVMRSDLAGVAAQAARGESVLGDGGLERGEVYAVVQPAPGERWD